MRIRKTAGPLENRARKIVKARLQRGDRDRVAEAAGHLGPWLSGWIRGRQDATLDEIFAVLTALGVSAVKAFSVPDADDADWEVFGLMGRLTTAQQKADARELVAGLASGETLIVSRRPSAPAATRPLRTTHKSRREA